MTASRRIGLAVMVVGFVGAAVLAILPPTGPLGGSCEYPITHAFTPTTTTEAPSSNPFSSGGDSSSSSALDSICVRINRQRLVVAGVTAVMAVLAGIIVAGLLGPLFKE